MWILVCSFLSAQSSPTDKSNCFSKCRSTFWASADSVRAFTTASSLFPAFRFPWPQCPADPLPLVLLCGGTLRSDNFLQCSEAAETLCGTACFPVPCLCQWGSPETRQQREAGSQRGTGLGRLEGGRELETDLIKGRRPSGDHGDRDTHLNNSGTNKSFRLGSAQDVKWSWILMHFSLPSTQNVALLNNLTLKNQYYFKSIPHKVNEESGYGYAYL